jgi:hypothetical protein
MASIHLSIADPCHENWNQMLPEEKGRFCLSCQKTVVDFTNMTDGQIFDYFKNYKGNTCGQFTRDQLDRNIAQPRRTGLGRWKYVWQMLLPAVFAFYKSHAQPALKGKVAPTTVGKQDTTNEVIRIGMVARKPVEESEWEVHGLLTNDKQEPVPFATITSSNGKYAVADSAGRFTIYLNHIKKPTLIISRAGYEPQEMPFDSLVPSHVKQITVSNNRILVDVTISLSQKIQYLPEVVTIGNPNHLIPMYAGGLTMVKTSTFYKTTVKPVTPDSSLKIFPNPIQRGQDFQLTAQVKKPGNYLLRLVNANGKILLEQQLNLINKTQTEWINGKSLQQPGTYIVQLISQEQKKNRRLTGKLVVQ